MLIALSLIASTLACNYGNFQSATPEPEMLAVTPAFLVATPSAPSPPTPTLAPSPTPSPTPIAEVRLQEAIQAQEFGNWEEARDGYQTLVQQSEEPATQLEGRFGLARTQYESGDFEQAAIQFQSLISEFPDEPISASYYFYYGKTLSALGRYQEAAEAYLNYMILRPGLIDAYVLNLRARTLANAGDYAAALIDYRAALQSPGLLNREQIEINIAYAHARVGDYGTAIGIYQDIYNRTSSDITHAQMDYEIGQAYLALGQPEAAYQAFQDAVNNYPQANASYQALLTLVEANVPVNELQRGVVDYYAGQYGVALAALDRYFQTEGPELAKARYFNGLILRALGEYSSAIAEWDLIIQGHPDEIYWDDAWEAKAYSQWAFLGDYPGGIQTLLNFVTTAPAHPRAAEFLFDAAQIAELDGQLNLAGDLFERVATEYPGDEHAIRATFLSGLVNFRLANYSEALNLFQKSSSTAADLESRSAAILWQAKVQQAQGDLAAAQATFELAANTDPTGYYSERARDFLLGRQPFTPPEMYDLSLDLERERQQAEIWMRATFNIAENTDLSIPGTIAGESGFQRGLELWRLGQVEDARGEFEALRQTVAQDPVACYQLAGFLKDLGLYRSAIFAARQVLNLAGMSDADTLNAPLFFNHIRFGVYYAGLVLPAAEEYGFHPLFLFSVIRQESAFEGFVSSSAGARGLMQIIPATGDEISNNLNWPPDYTSADLYRPVVSVRLGTDYLDQWRDHFNGDMYAALAAYNGGPGNAIAWKALAGDDPDLFVEVIRFEETRNYIQSIYEIFNLYRRIYNRTP